MISDAASLRTERDERERGETREIVIIESQVWAVMERPGGDKNDKTKYFRLRLSA